MKNKQLSWGLYQSAKQWVKRPSELVDIQDTYAAYCFDEAIGAWGSYVTSEIEKIEGKDSKSVERKRQNRLMQLLDVAPEKRFRQVGRKRPES